MRTIRVSRSLDVGSGSKVTIETEVIVEDDDAHQAGYDAATVISRFEEGMVEAWKTPE